MRLAGFIGCSWTEALERTTHRQFIVWMEWFRRQWNRPERTDYYLMQLANFLIRSKDEPGKRKIKFTFERPRRRRRAKQVEETLAREAFISTLGGDVTRNRISKAEAERIAALPLAEQAAERRRLAREKAGG